MGAVVGSIVGEAVGTPVGDAVGLLVVAALGSWVGVGDCIIEAEGLAALDRPSSKPEMVAGYR